MTWLFALLLAVCVSALQKKPGYCMCAGFTACRGQATHRDGHVTCVEGIDCEVSSRNTSQFATGVSINHVHGRRKPRLSPNEFINEVILSLAIGFSPLWVGFIVAQVISAYAIPSQSMDGTLKMGDVVIAEKISSYLRLPVERGDLIFFAAPQELEEIILRSGGRIGARDLFIKRIAAVEGDEVVVLESGGILVNGVPRKSPPLACRPDRQAQMGNLQGRSADEQEALRRVQSLLDAERITAQEADALRKELMPLPEQSAVGAADVVNRQARRRVFGNIEQKAVNPQYMSRTVVPPRSVFVLGDCESRSTDSRIWGPLSKSRVVGRPVVRVWPIERLGAIDTSEDLNPFRRSLLRWRVALEEATLPKQADR
mmetsp:Transcript_76557/g.127621  ORF Transcript_76557/g.127621 Transcript_76557/m.127621 type:complete len:371 (+) Transcript_76557:176-1288(+)|eukprot:CAMPEP_0119321072 /NCGR_PEP_ID=MMETSP1333-20130426/54305_1 /TAXON_ID=418940 /ORGANISM="Scyphosphaera apsteinii, Strain RCC1455" /LENGTH=370 /DNA_ID=CAMNT_0007327941 /DNA_START=176 /DNA_END=1288 /DNA_ORIENTATION=-